MCKYCRYHYVFHIFPGGDEQERPEHLEHHFRDGDSEWYPTPDVDSSPAAKFYPIEGRFRFFCTMCSLQIALEITLPRLKPEWVQMIMDENRMKENLRKAKEEDPDRFSFPPEKEALLTSSSFMTLNQYLRNIVEDDTRRISRRNKTFQIQFGEACEFLFRYLEFEDGTDNNGDACWIQPRLTPQEGKTPLGSPRAFYEDVRSEVQSILGEKPPGEGQPVVKPWLAREQLEKVLRCGSTARLANQIPLEPNEEENLRILGAPERIEDSLLEFAYCRQIETDPEHASDYLRALGDLAGCRSVDLQMFVFEQQELLSKRQNERVTAALDAGPTESAYAHFNLSSDCPEPASYFINVYRTYREQSPAQLSAHRLALLQIGKDRNNQEILNEVYSTKMDLSEACQLLRVSSEWPMDSIAAQAQSVSSDVDFDLLLMALEAISKSRPQDDPNRPAFESVLTELRSTRYPQSPGGPATQSGNHLSQASGSRNAEAPPVVDYQLPVGLANLRNTCYLNSMLQYFYSVNAVRDLALKSDLRELEPTEESMKELLRSINTEQQKLETGRAFVGHEFTRELSTLFRELDRSRESSVTPRQRLANAALLRPEKLRQRSAEPKDTPGSSNGEAPPLPPRTGAPLISNLPAAPMEIDQSDSVSTHSSLTLIGDASSGTVTVDVNLENGKETVVQGNQAPADKLPSDYAMEASSERPSEGEAQTSKLTVEELAAELDKPNVGSDQMDVDEVMGNAIDHLRAAFKVSRIGQSDNIPDPIEQAFFSTFIDNRKKIGEADWNRSSRTDRWVTAYPAPSGSRDLYEALANSFDLERMSDDLLSFTTIEHPAPHFHICIQRADGVRKNSNPIIIPETLYLDRFMHTADTNSPIFQARKRRWDIRTRLAELDKSPGKAANNANARAQTTGRSSPAEQEFTDEEIDDFILVTSPKTSAPADGSLSAQLSHGQALDNSEIERLLAKYGPIETPSTQPAAHDQPQMRQGASAQERAQSPNADSDSVSIPPAELTGFWEMFIEEEQIEQARLLAERDNFFKDSQSVAYRLHAVICHAGSASAGHYWVWIHDFEQDVWRKYNDTTVSVHPASFVFDQLSTKGEPYYLAYVRADKVNELVSIPRRRPPTPPPVPPRAKSPVDVPMVDVDGERSEVQNGEVIKVEFKENVEEEKDKDTVIIPDLA